MGNTYFKYCSENNDNTLSSWCNGEERIGFVTKRFDNEADAEKAGYTRHFPEKPKRGRKKKTEILVLDDNENG